MSLSGIAQVGERGLVEFMSLKRTSYSGESDCVACSEAPAEGLGNYFGRKVRSGLAGDGSGIST